MNYRVLLDSPDTPTSTIQVGKLGDFSDPRYGDFSITAGDVEAWKTNLSLLPGGKALIDLDHRADKAGAARSTEAAGWITDIDLADGVPTATVEWTPVGQKAIAERRYQFFSPAFGQHSIEGTIHDNVLSGGALTNRPFLQMPTIQLASDDRITSTLLDDADIQDRLVFLLGVSADERKLAVKEGNALPDGSYPIRNTAQLHSAAILASSGHGNVQAAKALIKRRAKELGVDLNSLPGFGTEPAKKAADSPAPMDVKLLEALDLSETATEDDAVAAIERLKIEPGPESKLTLEQQAEADGKIVLDSAQVAQLVQNANEGAEAKKQLDANRFEQTFTAALQSGKAVEAQREDYTALYELDKDRTLKMLDDAPPIVNVKPIGRDHREPADQAPDGIQPENFLLDQAVRKKLLDEKRPMSDYIAAVRELNEQGLSVA